MNKQEQIETMSEIMYSAPHHFAPMNVDALRIRERDARSEAEALVAHGYINGADFVEWLKEKFGIPNNLYFKTWMSGADLDKALQEYLKGE